MPRKVKSVILFVPILFMASGCDILKRTVSREGEARCRGMASQERTDFMAKKIYDDCIATVDVDLAAEKKREYQRVAAGEMAANQAKQKRADAWEKRLAWCPSIRDSYKKAEQERLAALKPYSAANTAFGWEETRPETIAYKRANDRVVTIEKRIISFDNLIYPEGWDKVVPFTLKIYMRCDPREFKD